VRQRMEYFDMIVIELKSFPLVWLCRCDALYLCEAHV